MSNCIYKDAENGWCKLHSYWSDSMPVIEYCVEGPCPDEKSLTNAERIRTMSDEELAEFVTGTDFCETTCHQEHVCDGKCEAPVLKWLNQEAI